MRRFDSFRPSQALQVINPFSEKPYQLLVARSLRLLATLRSRALDELPLLCVQPTCAEAQFASHRCAPPLASHAPIATWMVRRPVVGPGDFACEDVLWPLRPLLANQCSGPQRWMSNTSQRLSEGISLCTARGFGGSFPPDPLDTHKRIERHALSRVHGIRDQELRRVFARDNFPRATCNVEWIVRLAHRATCSQHAVELVDCRRRQGRGRQGADAAPSSGASIG